MPWEESEHPRNPHTGEFVGKPGGGGDWATLLTARLTGAPRRELTPDDVDYAELERLVDERRSRGEPESRDDALGKLYEAQGFHARPQVVSADEMDRLILRGWQEVWRGVGGSYGDLDNAREYARQFREGPEHYPGAGIYGNGTYAAENPREARGYTSFDTAGFPEDATNEEWDAAYDDPRNWPGLLRIAIPPTVRVISRDEVSQAWYAWFNERHQKVADERGVPVHLVDPQDVADSEYWVRVDHGRAATIMGYDVMTVPSGNLGEPYYIILNRGAVAVQEAT